VQVFPPGEVIDMNEDDHLPDSKKEEQDSSLSKALSLAPLFAVILQAVELILKLLGIIR
jgi:hypothetical protein